MRRFVGVVGFEPPTEMLIHHVRAWTADRALKKIWEYIHTYHDMTRRRVRYIELGTLKEFWGDEPLACRFIGLRR